ncbi:YbjQ family protein [Oceaniglobus trochenteri]|uniref:YbjQ family protein n=1 Tax=Oceaniglobus trochenteri TaxID=2763260 RepID=UPI001CFF9ED3|nr:YbjQ family protein [Oceaniglobus trochenteri]
MTRSKSDIIVTTTDGVAGREVVEVLGLVRGSTVRAKHIGSDIVASLRNLVGGEVKEYAQLLAAAREQSYDRMVAEAAGLNADAIVGTRMETSTIMNAASEVVFYGTAVRLR